jgi:CheY-like chemotaxis protein
MIAMSAPLLLIVDDSKMSRLMIAKIIADMRPEWRIVEAASGEEALTMIEQEKPDLVSMDVNMPGMNGLQAAGHIRLHHPDIRVALCTANIQEAMRLAAERAGVFFVGKPITPQSIAKMIELFES